MGWTSASPNAWPSGCGSWYRAAVIRTPRGPTSTRSVSPAVLTRGLGSHVWDADGNEFIEYGMGLRAVGLGHAYPQVVDAVRNSLDLGTNFTRPAQVELECAERFLRPDPQCRDGEVHQGWLDGDERGAQARSPRHGSRQVAICAEHPFFSYDDWFMATTTMDGGIADGESDRVVGFTYNDVQSVRRVFDDNPEQIAAVFLEPARTEPPADGFLEELRDVVHDEWSRAGLRRDDHGLPILAARCA